MSFPRAPIKRFNEAADSTIPPLGTYDPKFATDVSVSSGLKGLVFEKWGRNNVNGKTRMEDIELSPANRVGRDLTRKSSTQVSNTGRRSNPSPSPYGATLRPQLKSRTPSMTSYNLRKMPSSTSSSALSKSQRNPEVKVAAAALPEKVETLDPTKSMPNVQDNALVCQDVLTRIQEIQNMAEGLQVEVSEYKRRLTTELIRNQELEAKQCELEFTNQTLRRELTRYDMAKEAWVQGEQSLKNEIFEISNSKANLELQLNDLQKNFNSYKETESNLQEKLTILEGEKELWQNNKTEYEGKVDQLKVELQELQSKLTESEEKCKELLSQMDSCYHICESRMVDAESTKEIFEVKVQELTQQKEDLQKQVDNMRRELETEKTLTELMKSEQASISLEQSSTPSNQTENYIS